MLRLKVINAKSQSRQILLRIIYLPNMKTGLGNIF